MRYCSWTECQLRLLHLGSSAGRNGPSSACKSLRTPNRCGLSFRCWLGLRLFDCREYRRVPCDLQAGDFLEGGGGGREAVLALRIVHVTALGFSEWHDLLLFFNFPAGCLDDFRLGDLVIGGDFCRRKAVDGQPSARQCFSFPLDMYLLVYGFILPFGIYVNTQIR